MSRVPQGERGVDRAMYVMEEHTGVVPGYRRAHPRGVGFRGRFTASGEASALTTAEHLQGDPVETVVRLSNAAGSPYTPDRRSARRGNVLGLAVRFELPSGGHSTWAAPSIPAFPASTPEEFVALASALQRSRRTGRLPPARLCGAPPALGAGTEGDRGASLHRELRHHPVRRSARLLPRRRRGSASRLPLPLATRCRHRRHHSRG